LRNFRIISMIIVQLSARESGNIDSSINEPSALAIDAVNGQHIPAARDDGLPGVVVQLHEHVGRRCCRLFGGKYAVDVEFRSPCFADISVNQWMALSPRELVRTHLNLNDAALDALSKTKPVIVRPAAMHPDLPPPPIGRKGQLP
jgi:hypothetical protein